MNKSQSIDHGLYNPEDAHDRFSIQMSTPLQNEERFSGRHQRVNSTTGFETERVRIQSRLKKPSSVAPQSSYFEETRETLAVE